MLLLLVMALVAGCGSGGGHGGHAENTDAAEGARTIEVEATSFAFDPEEIVAAPGEDLAVELTATDAEHDFVIDELDAHIGADAGDTATGGFDVGDEAGTYTYYCSVAGHREAGMEGTLVVE